MLRLGPTLALALLAFIPGGASAHGQEVLLFPVGTLIAVVAVVGLAVLCKVRRASVFLVGVLAFAASLPFWFIPENYFPSAMHHTGLGNFITGFFPSVAVGALAVWQIRRARRPR